MVGGSPPPFSPAPPFPSPTKRKVVIPRALDLGQILGEGLANSTAVGKMLEEVRSVGELAS